MADSLPTNPLVGPLLTDMYQISMAYAHWINGRYDDMAVFDLFFRRCPFGGEFCIVAGTDEVVKFLASYRFSESDVEYLKSIMPHCDPAFFSWLLTLDCSRVKLYAMREGSVVFPREPLIRVEAPLVIGQLIETTLLNLINFPSLIATNAARMRLAAGADKSLLEFGLRRAQGPDGALSASKYAYIGGFDGTSNVLAGKLFGIDVRGTQAHAYVMCYTGLNQLRCQTITSPTDPNLQVPFVDVVLEKRQVLGFTNTNEGELAAFIAYAQAFPHNFLALVDTFDTLKSGVPNFLVVGLALHEIGHTPRGIRLDSGDLSYLSTEARQMFRDADAKIGKTVFTSMTIVASNDINEEVLVALSRQGHEIDSFGIGTHLVTCQRQPALGCVYKLVEVNGNARIKLSQDVEKVVIPGKKVVYRLYGRDGRALIDVMQNTSEPAPVAGTPVLCRHPFQEQKRANVTPSRVEEILPLLWDEGHLVESMPSLEDTRSFCRRQLENLRSDIIRQTNPTPYKVSVSAHLFQFMHDLWLREAPIEQLE